VVTDQGGFLGDRPIHYAVNLSTPVIRDRHILAIDSAARYDPRTRKETCDYDGLYYAIGKFIQEIVEKQGTTDFELQIQRKGASG